MSDENKKISKNRVKKEEIVAKLDEKLGKSKAVVFTNYERLTHKQLEGLKRAIKPMQAEFIIAKNSLVLRALDNNKIKVEDEKQFEGPTGTLLMYEDFVEPLKQLAKLIKELGIPSVKFGVIEGKNITGDEVLKLSTLPSREALLAQLVGGLKSPIFGLHRTLNWNLQRLVLTLSAIASSRPATVADDVPVSKISNETLAQPVQEVSEPEPETILMESKEEKAAEQATPKIEEVKNEGGEN